MKRLALVGAALLVASQASRAAAQHGPPLPGEGADINTSNYRIDLFQGPVLGGARVTGLGGAYAPISEGVAGFNSNSAAPAVRPLWSRSWFDFDYDLGITFPNALRKTDFDNNGSVGFTYSNFVFLTAGLNLQFGEWGFGASAQYQQYELGSDAAGTAQMRVGLQRYNVLLARSFFDGQLMIGAGLRAVALSLNTREGGAGAANDSTEFSTSSAGPEAGMIFAPLAIPMRFALTGRGAMAPDTANEQTSDKVVKEANGAKYLNFRTPIYLPKSVELPWEIEAGVALQLGRPLNEQWVNPHDPPDEYLEVKKLPDGGKKYVLNKKLVDQRLRARHNKLPRKKLLISASVIVFGPVRDAIGVESFLKQTVERSGRNFNVSPRLGIEAEPFANALQVRAGTYLEPTRFGRSNSRLHGTLGFEARVFRWSVFGLLDEDTSWRVGAYGDVARDYFGWGVTLGTWY